MLFRKYASLIVAFLLVVLVIGACVVRSTRPAPRRSGGPVYVEKHKHKQHKHKKQKKQKHRKWKN
jgi:hypothetical protein